MSIPKDPISLLCYTYNLFKQYGYLPRNTHLHIITKYIAEISIEEVLQTVDEPEMQLFIAMCLREDEYLESAAEWYLQAYKTVGKIPRLYDNFDYLHTSAKDDFNQTLDELVVCSDAKQRIFSILTKELEHINAEL